MQHLITQQMRKVFSCIPSGDIDHGVTAKKVLEQCHQHYPDEFRGLSPQQMGMLLGKMRRLQLVVKFSRTKYIPEKQRTWMYTYWLRKNGASVGNPYDQYNHLR